MSKNSAKQNLTQVIEHLKSKGLWKKPTKPSRRSTSNRPTYKKNFK